MLSNTHQQEGNTRELLNIKLFSQPFNSDTQPELQLEECKSIAKLYAKLENTISALSDMSSRKSYIYAGASAQQMGFGPTGSEINSIWEDELLSKIHHEDLQKNTF